MTLAPRRWAYIVSLWLGLATIFAHALDPSGSPLTKSSGSAFNPFTSEVSLAPKRATLPDKDWQDQDVSSAGSDRTDGDQADVPHAYAQLLLRLRSPVAGVTFPTPGPTALGRLDSRAFQARAPPPA